MFARRAAAEVVAADEHGGAATFGLVQHEVLALAAVLLVTPIGEQVTAEAFLRSGRQKSRRDDLIGVDVVVRQNDRLRDDLLYRCHDYLAYSRGSTIAPLIAAA